MHAPRLRRPSLTRLPLAVAFLLISLFPSNLGVAQTDGQAGQSQVFSGIEESTLAAATLALPGTSRTRFGIVETAGDSVTVRAAFLVQMVARWSAPM